LSRIARTTTRPQRLLSQTTRRSFVVVSRVRMDDLPYHIVVGLPALSPTMERGSLAEWYVNEGDAINAGDAIAQIETDKASMDFEAQDDSYVAKILLQAGSGEIDVGTPILITVEDEEDIAAFQNYTPPPVEVATTPPKEEETKEATPEPPTPEPTPEPVVAAPPPPPVAEPVAAAKESVPPPSSPEFVVAWGSSASTKSPLAKTLAAKQKAYLDLYGTTGQLPLM